MSHVEPLDTPAAREQFAGLAQLAGFVPNSLLTMARRPEVTDAFMNLLRAANQSSEIEPGLRRLVAVVASTSAGCQYCQTHQAAVFVKEGGDQTKLEAVWEFEQSPLFDDREKAALRLARDAGSVPNAAGAAHFAELREHFSDDQIIDIVTMIAIFGFLNRWNDTLATQLEDEPLSVGRAVGIAPGKHAPAAS